MDCQPPSQTKDWPSRDEVRSQLHDQLARVIDLLSSASADALTKIAHPDRGPQTIAARIIHGFHDEAKHSGEMYLIFKLCRAGGSA